jgi:tight adherence protein C
MFDHFIALLWALSIATGCAGLVALGRLLKERPRQHMDPLPLLLRLLWPLVKTCELVIEPWLDERLRNNLQKKLQHAGIAYMLNAAEFLALQTTVAGLLLLLAQLCAKILDSQLSMTWSIGITTSGFLLPLLSLRDARKRRENRILRDLPVFLDFIVMAVEAGLNLTGGLQQAARLGPDGPLRQELSKVLRDIRTGANRQTALRNMADRLGVKELSVLISALLQAEQSGASLGATLRIQAEQRRAERFQRAEKLAMEAPVKLIFPLVVFIFPVTFLILAFPIIMKFMYEM